ncbi:MAG TPA: DUF397 domain-containing protein [Pseudonocardiaceae bacterium]|nr:DUF397 domain-containing protein [Pseudonocardiaceae bacterium]
MTSSLAARGVPALKKKEYGMVDVPQPPTTASWQKSGASGADGECVQVIRSREHVWVRDSKDSLGQVLGFTTEEWAAFLLGVQRDQFDRSGVTV